MTDTSPTASQQGTSALTCPNCGSSSSLGFDWDTAVTARIEDGVLHGVCVAGVFACVPDRVHCGACGQTNPCPLALGDATGDILTGGGYSDLGWDVTAVPQS